MQRPSMSTSIIGRVLCWPSKLYISWEILLIVQNQATRSHLIWFATTAPGSSHPGRAEVLSHEQTSFMVTDGTMIWSRVKWNFMVTLVFFKTETEAKQAQSFLSSSTWDGPTVYEQAKDWKTLGFYFPKIARLIKCTDTVFDPVKMIPTVNHLLDQEELLR